MDLNALRTQPTSNPKLGYALDDSNSASNSALNRAKNHLTAGKKAGSDIRNWVKDAEDKVASLLSSIRKDFGNKQNIRQSPSWDKRLYKITYWENETARIVRLYFGEMSGITGRLKQLNPPLNSEQLDLFVKEIHTDRQTTISFLEKMTSVLHELAEFKILLYRANSKLSEFSPSP